MTTKKQEIENKLAEIETAISSILTRLAQVEQSLGSAIDSEGQKSFCDTKNPPNKFIDPFDALIEG